MTIGCEKTLSSNLSSVGEDFSEKVLKNSKLLLTGTFTELKANSVTDSRSVELYLTSSGELLVLKKSTAKPYRLSLVRRHNLKNTMFSQHPRIANAMQAEVPNTVLRYVYQLENTGPTEISVREWLTELTKCPESSSFPNPLLKSESSESCNETTESATKDSRKGVINGLTLHVNAPTALKKPHWTSYTSPTSPVAHKRAPLLEEKKSGSTSVHERMDVQETSTIVSSDCHEAHFINDVTIMTKDEVADEDSFVDLSKYHDELDVLNLTRERCGSLRVQSPSTHHSMMRSSSERFFSRGKSFKDTKNRKNGLRKTSVSTSELSSLKSPTEDFGSCALNRLSQCVDPETAFSSSKFHHMQIRKRKWKYSPRINRSSSYHPGSSDSHEEQFTRSISVSPASHLSDIHLSSG